MPAPKYRSGRFRKVVRRTPGGRLSMQYKKRKPQAAKCSSCGAVLKGVPRARTYELKSFSKSKKRPQRPYGGSLCSRCMRQKIVETAA